MVVFLEQFSAETLRKRERILWLRGGRRTRELGRKNKEGEGHSCAQKSDFLACSKSLR